MKLTPFHNVRLFHYGDFEGVNVIQHHVHAFRLEDFENSCAAYEKAIELSGDDYLTFLNYSITLYLNDEVERARDHFKRVQVLTGLQNDSEMDPDVAKQIELLGLQLK